MKIRITLFCSILVFSAALMPAKTPPKPADFSGKWLLDTGQTKNLPQGLESYNMVVSQDKQQLKVETKLKGDLRPISDLSGPYPNGPQGPSYPGGSRGGVYGGGGVGMGRGGMGRMGGMPGGGSEQPMGEGMPLPGSDGDGTQRTSRHPLENTAAFTLYPSSAVYKLDGSETSAQLGGPAHTDATLKGNWAKNGQVLKLSLDGNDYSGMGDKIQLKDQWKLSKDGTSLLVERSVRSRSGSTTVHMVFHKQPTQTGSSPGH